MVFEKILAPDFLVRNIGVIALIIAGFVLVLFDDFVTRAAFRFADRVRVGAASRISEYGGRRGVSGFFSKYLSEALATAIILVYVYFATTVLAVYVFAPILASLRNILLLVLIVVFLIISYVVNQKSVRERLRRL